MAVYILYASGRDFPLTFDAILRENHQGTVTVTRHPVERGAAVTDHFQAEPLVLTLEGAVSEFSLDGDADARIARALELLEELKLLGELVTVATPHRTYDSMKLISYDASRDPARSGQVRASLSFESVRVVDSQVIAVTDRRAPARSKGKLDEGKQVATEAPAVVVNKSAALKLYDGDYNFFGGGD